MNRQLWSYIGDVTALDAFPAAVIKQNELIAIHSANLIAGMYVMSNTSTVAVIANNVDFFIFKCYQNPVQNFSQK